VVALVTPGVATLSSVYMLDSISNGLGSVMNFSSLFPSTKYLFICLFIYFFWYLLFLHPIRKKKDKRDIKYNVKNTLLSVERLVEKVR